MPGCKIHLSIKPAEDGNFNASRERERETDILYIYIYMPLFRCANVSLISMPQSSEMNKVHSELLAFLSDGTRPRAWFVWCFHEEKYKMESAGEACQDFTIQPC